MKVVIIGGGAAGIAAAYCLLKKDTQVSLFEARATYGGRAMTSTAIRDFNFDAGPLYIQDPSENPWRDIANELKFETIKEKTGALLRIDKDDHWIDEPPTTPDVHKIEEAIAISYEKAKASPNVIVAPKPAFKYQVERFAQATSPYGPFSEAAEVWQYIAADRARMSMGTDEENLLVKKGLGTLVKTYGSQLKKKFPKTFTEYLGTPIGEIAYDDHGLTATSANGKVKAIADACIVTVPVSILAANKIKFKPALPAAYGTALKALQLGSYKKLAVKLKVAPTAIAVDTNYYCLQTEPEGIWQYYRLSMSPNVLVTHAAGDFAAKLDAMRDTDVYKLFQDTIQEAYPDEKIQFSSNRAITNWTKDPYALGAYSYTAFIGGGPQDPTALNARVQLSKPVKTVHFAGEANSLSDYGTIAGAHQAGVAAANAILHH